jgi:hypothetical protein
LVKPFLLTKRSAGIGKQCLKTENFGRTYANGIVVLAEGLDMFKPGVIVIGWRIIPSGNLFFTKRNFVR